MANDGKHFPNASALFGFGGYAQLPDIIDRSYTSNTESSVTAITLSDSADLNPYATSFLLATAGDVAVVTDKDQTVLFKALNAGQVYKFPFRIKRFKAAGTTATGVLAMG
jgi:hypothetical protein